jgi:hypothetical protein
MAALTLDDLYASPNHYLHSFDGDAAIFMPMDRAAYHRSIFLDARISPAANQSMRIPVQAIASRARHGAATGWIFHIAHCGSTLLARALDDDTASLVLREPLALRQLALAPDRTRLAITATMLSKRYRAEAPTIVKANVPVNFILPDLAARQPNDAVILLHCTLRDYLLAILRSDDHRGWLRRVTAQLAAHLGDVARLTDAERAAALWLAQMQTFARALELFPNARALDAETFFARPAAVLKATVGGPLFSTYSKNPEVAFDNAARIARRASLDNVLTAEIDQAQRWVDRTADTAETATAALTRAALV